jgi:hypothetical protein
MVTRDLHTSHAVVSWLSAASCVAQRRENQQRFSDMARKLQGPDLIRWQVEK